MRQRQMRERVSGAPLLRLHPRLYGDFNQYEAYLTYRRHFENVWKIVQSQPQRPVQAISSNVSHPIQPQPLCA